MGAFVEFLQKKVYSACKIEITDVSYVSYAVRVVAVDYDFFPFIESYGRICGNKIFRECPERK